MVNNNSTHLMSHVFHELVLLLHLEVEAPDDQIVRRLVTRCNFGSIVPGFSILSFVDLNWHKQEFNSSTDYYRMYQSSSEICLIDSDKITDTNSDQKTATTIHNFSYDYPYYYSIYNFKFIINTNIIVLHDLFTLPKCILPSMRNFLLSSNFRIIPYSLINFSFS